MKAFNDLKREGIRKHNQCRIAENSDDLIGECLCTGQVMCSGCSGFFKKEYFYRHRKNCVLSPRAVGVKRAASLPSPDDEEWQGVMLGMRRDATFDVVTADLLIQVIGHDIEVTDKVCLLILSGAVCCENQRASFLRSFSFQVHFSTSSLSVMANKKTLRTIPFTSDQ